MPSPAGQTWVDLGRATFSSVGDHTQLYRIFGIYNMANAHHHRYGGRREIKSFKLHNMAYRTCHGGGHGGGRFPCELNFHARYKYKLVFKFNSRHKSTNLMYEVNKQPTLPRFWCASRLLKCVMLIRKPRNLQYVLHYCRLIIKYYSNTWHELCALLFSLAWYSAGYPTLDMDVL